MIFPKDIERFTLGRVVYEISPTPTRRAMRNETFGEKINIGHVVGFDLNSKDEVIVKVLFADNDKQSLSAYYLPGPRSIHPSNLEIA